MIRVRRSTLEEFRRLVETEWGDEARLVAYVEAGQQDPEPRWQAAAGTAFHTCLECPDEGYDFEADTYTVGGYTFDAKDVQAALALIGPGGDWEVEARGVYPTPLGPVEVSCTADWRRGLTIQDNKTKWGSAADLDDYEAALQWRFYLDAHGCDVFRYLFFEFKEPDDAGFCELKAVGSARFWRYDRLNQDCRLWCERFARWARSRGLLPLLTGKGVPVGT